MVDRTMVHGHPDYTSSGGFYEVRLTNIHTCGNNETLIQTKHILKTATNIFRGSPSISIKLLGPNDGRK